MNKQLLVLAMSAVFGLSLGACSSDSGGSSDGSGNGSGGGGADAGNGTAGSGDTGAGDGGTGDGANADGGTSIGNPDVTPGPSGGGAPTGDTVAGNYVGDFGFGDGVYVVNADSQLFGLALNDDGSAISLFGNLGSADAYEGTLRQQTHDPSRPATAGVFGAGRSDFEAAGPFSLNIVAGQSIESTAPPAVSLRFAAAGSGEITPATLDSVGGATWSAVNQFCPGDDGAFCKLVTEVTFNGTSVTGETHLENDSGEEVFTNPIDGTVVEYGDVLLVSFNWGTATGENPNLNRYDGIVFFTTDGTGRLVFLGETEAEQDESLAPDGVGNPTIATLLSR